MNVNVFAPDGLVARKEGSSWTYYTFDQQGNVAQRLNSSQVVQTSRVFDAWGDGAETTTPRSYDCWNYNGKWGYYYDRETGLYYCQNRMYDSTTGRWINRDPIGYAGGINLYGYCGGAPNGAADNVGLAPRVTWLYKLVDTSTGDLVKWGITYHPNSRYRKWWLGLNGYELQPQAFYHDRKCALADERVLSEEMPGPLNREPWAGSKVAPALPVGVMPIPTGPPPNGSLAEDVWETVDPTVVGTGRLVGEAWIAFANSIAPDPTKTCQAIRILD